MRIVKVRVNWWRLFFSIWFSQVICLETMRRFPNLLLLATTIITLIVSSSSIVWATRIIESENSSSSSIYTSFNKSIYGNKNDTITHTIDLDTDLNHLVVDRNTGRVSILQASSIHIECEINTLSHILFVAARRYSSVVEIIYFNCRRIWIWRWRPSPDQRTNRKNVVSTNAHRIWHANWATMWTKCCSSTTARVDWSRAVRRCKAVARCGVYKISATLNKKCWMPSLPTVKVSKSQIAHAHPGLMTSFKFCFRLIS